MTDQSRNHAIGVDEPPRKIMFLGDENIGKTTFIRNYCNHLLNLFGCETVDGKFLIFNQYYTHVPRFERKVPVRFLDLPPATDFESRRDQYPAQVNLVVFCFAVDNPESFHRIATAWIPEVSRYYGPRTRRYLLGLKSEMRVGSVAGNQVPMQNAIVFHAAGGFCGEYMEVSSEINPDRAHSIMSKLVDESFVYSAEPPIAPQD